MGQTVLDKDCDDLVGTRDGTMFTMLVNCLEKWDGGHDVGECVLAVALHPAWS